MDEDALIRVGIRDLQVSAQIGMRAHEIGRRQPLIVSVCVTISPPDDDDLSATFDYCEIERLAHEIAEEKIILVETFARRIARGCLNDPRVLAVEVSIEKPEALVSGMAGVRFRAGKDDRPAWIKIAG